MQINKVSVRIPCRSFPSPIAVGLLMLSTNACFAPSLPENWGRPEPRWVSDAIVQVEENTSDVFFTAEVDALTSNQPVYSISGPDSVLFIIEPTSGELRFRQRPDHETPASEARSNEYRVTLTVDDDGLRADHDLTVVVNDVIELELTLDIDAGTNPKEVVFSWSNSGDDVDEIASYRLEVDSEGDGQFEPEPRVEVIGGERSSEHMLLPLHLIEWRTASYRLVAHSSTEQPLSNSPAVVIGDRVRSEDVIGYLKASNTDAGDRFGASVAISADGSTIAVGAPGEASGAVGINGNQDSDVAPGAGAVYIFRRNGRTWNQEAYLKASIPNEDDAFGHSVALSADGTLLVVGAPGEDSAGTGIDGGLENDNTISRAGAAYLFTYDGSAWAQSHYLKAETAASGGKFGNDVQVSDQGDVVVVVSESGGEDFEPVISVFNLGDEGWAATVVTNPSSTARSFGLRVALSTAGNELVASAPFDSLVPESDPSYPANEFVGSLLVFESTPSSVNLRAYLSASSAERGDVLGESDVALSGDGGLLAATQYNRQPQNIILFRRIGTEWQEEEPLETPAGFSTLGTGIPGKNWLVLDNHGRLIVQRVEAEVPVVPDIGSGAFDGISFQGKLVLLRERKEDVWEDGPFLAARNPATRQRFGDSLAMSDNAEILVVGAPQESSSSTGINNVSFNTGAPESGAVYLY